MTQAEYNATRSANKMTREYEERMKSKNIPPYDDEADRKAVWQRFFEAALNK